MNLWPFYFTCGTFTGCCCTFALLHYHVSEEATQEQSNFNTAVLEFHKDELAHAQCCTVLSLLELHILFVCLFGDWGGVLLIDFTHKNSVISQLPYERNRGDLVQAVLKNEKGRKEFSRVSERAQSFFQQFVIWKSVLTIVVREQILCMSLFIRKKKKKNFPRCTLTSTVYAAPDMNMSEGKDQAE